MYFIYHVCADGRRSVDRSSRWIWNFCVPFIPSSAPKPCNGTFDVPVTNWRNLARSAWSKLRNARQNHWICWIRIDINKRIFRSNSWNFYLNRVGLVFVIFCVCAQVFDVNIGQARDQKFELLLVENRNQSLRDDVVKALQKCVEPKRNDNYSNELINSI